MNIIKKAIRKFPGFRFAIKSIEFYLKCYLRFSQNRKVLSYSNFENDRGRLVVFGWYGTETVGDKFILLGVLYSLYKSRVKEDSIKVIASMNVIVTKKTMRELSDFLEKFGYEPSFLDYLHEFSVVDYNSVFSVSPNTVYVLGGGPIMDDPILVDWLMLSKAIKNVSSSSFVILGSGVGPLNRSISTKFTKSILNNADHLFLRNKSEVIDCSFHEVVDPAFLVYYIAKTKEAKKDSLGNLSINVRSIPFQYLQNELAQDSNVINEFSKYIIEALRSKSNIKKVSYFTTHQIDSTPDSFLCEQVISRTVKFLESAEPTRAIFIEGGSEDTVLSVAEVLLGSEFIVASRFHGVVLALVFGCKVAGLDYGEFSKVCKLYESLEAEVPMSRTFRFSGLSSIDFISMDDPIIKLSVETKTAPLLNLGKYLEI